MKYYKYSAVILVLSACFIIFSGCQDDTPVAGNYPTVGLSSWYIPHRTSSGEINRSQEYTCAMRKRDFSKYYLVCNLENNKCVVARHNDFGPSFFLFKQGRIIDLSKRAFSRIADLKKGVTRVRIGQVYPGQTD